VVIRPGFCSPARPAVQPEIACSPIDLLLSIQPLDRPIAIPSTGRAPQFDSDPMLGIYLLSQVPGYAKLKPGLRIIGTLRAVSDHWSKGISIPQGDSLAETLANARTSFGSRSIAAGAIQTLALLVCGA